MKQYGLISFFIVLLIITPQSDAANYQSQVDPTGANQYRLQITADTPQSFGTLLDVLRQQAQDVCQGPYDILNIDSPDAQNIIGAIACQSAAGTQQTPQPALQQQPRQEQPAAPRPNQAPAPDDSRSINQQPTSRTSPNSETLYPEFEESATANRSVMRTVPSQHRGFARRFGIGLWASLMNLGIGPSVEFYPLDSFGVMGTVGAFFDFTSASVRGMFLLPSLLELDDYPIRPYAGAGYTYIDWEDVADGYAIEAYGGVLFPLEVLLENLYLRGEFIYSNIEFDEDIDWATFSFGLGGVYFF